MPFLIFIIYTSGQNPLTQTILIELILCVMDMGDTNVKYTPVDRDPICYDMNYRSIVGMIYHLVGNTDHDIAKIIY